LWSWGVRKEIVGRGSLWISLIKRVLGVRVVAEGLRRKQLDKKSLT